MRELEGVWELHKSDNDYNPKVVDTVKSAKRAKSPRDFIDIINGSKEWKNIEDHIEWEVTSESISVKGNKRENAQTKNPKITQNMVEEKEEKVIEDIEEER